MSIGTSTTSELARNKVRRFTLIAVTNRLNGTTAGSALRPLAIQ